MRPILSSKRTCLEPLAEGLRCSSTSPLRHAHCKQNPWTSEVEHNASPNEEICDIEAAHLISEKKLNGVRHSSIPVPNEPEGYLGTNFPSEISLRPASRTTKSTLGQRSDGIRQAQLRSVRRWYIGRSTFSAPADHSCRHNVYFVTKVAFVWFGAESSVQRYLVPRTLPCASLRRKMQCFNIFLTISLSVTVAAERM